MSDEPNAMQFDNGMTDEERDRVDDLRIDIVRIKLGIEELGRHRSYSLAITKLDEAEHWLRDRAHRPA